MQLNTIRKLFKIQTDLSDSFIINLILQTLFDMPSTQLVKIINHLYGSYNIEVPNIKTTRGDPLLFIYKSNHTLISLSIVKDILRKYFNDRLASGISNTLNTLQYKVVQVATLTPYEDNYYIELKDISFKQTVQYKEDSLRKLLPYICMTEANFNKFNLVNNATQKIRQLRSLLFNSKVIRWPSNKQEVMEEMAGLYKYIESLGYIPELSVQGVLFPAKSVKEQTLNLITYYDIDSKSYKTVPIKDTYIGADLCLYFTREVQ